MIRMYEVPIGYLRLSKSDRGLNIRDGFQDHREKDYSFRNGHENVKRIIVAYKLSKLAQQDAESAFRVRGIWDEWITINHKNLIAVLEKEDVLELAKLLENLYREQFTIGTGGYDNYIRYKKPFGSWYIKYVWSNYRKKLLDLGYDINDVRFPCVGNPVGIKLDDQIISIDTLRHAYHAVEMSELLKDNRENTLVEIGGGLGGQAYQTLQMSGESISKYLIFDIPEVAAMSSYFLLSALPNKKVRLFGEGQISVDAHEDFDIAIFPHFTINQLSDGSVDLFYNSCSFSEMDSVTSREYLTSIERLCRRYFLHDNHDEKLEFKNGDGSISTNIIGSKLVPKKELFKRIFKKPRVHYLPEDRTFKHFEYLYERRLI